MKKWIFLLMVSLMMPAAMQAQDDLYFVPTKPNVEKSAKKYGMPARTYYSGSNRSVDDYNRRGTPDDIIYFDATPGVYPDSLQRDSLARRPFMAGDTLAMQQDDFEYSRRISRFDDDNWRSEAYWDGYRDGRRDWAWYDPWYCSWYDPWYCSWYDPWYHGRWGFGYSSWYGRPWYYGGWYGWHDPFYYSWYHPVVYVGGGGSYHPVRGGVAGTRNHGGGHARSGSFRGSRDNSGSSSRSTRNSNFRVRNDNNNYRNFNQNTNRSNNSQFSGSSSFGGSRGGSFGGGGGFGGGSRGSGGSRGGGRR